MMQKVIRCGIVGGLILFVWGAVFWMVLPWNGMCMMKFGDEDRVMRVIQDNASMSGLYFLPNMMNIPKGSPEMKKAQDQMHMGPVIFAAVSLEGKESNMMVPMVKALLLKIVAACLVTWLLFQTKVSYGKRVGFVTMAGVVIGLMATVPYWIWFAFPGCFVVSCLFEAVVGWFFAGLAIGKLVK